MNDCQGREGDTREKGWASKAEFSLGQWKYFVWGNECMKLPKLIKHTTLRVNYRLGWARCVDMGSSILKISHSRRLGCLVAGKLRHFYNFCFRFSISERHHTWWSLGNHVMMMIQPYLPFTKHALKIIELSPVPKFLHYYLNFSMNLKCSEKFCF